jgi:hypothetical protein
MALSHFSAHVVFRAQYGRSHFAAPIRSRLAQSRRSAMSAYLSAFRSKADIAARAGTSSKPRPAGRGYDDASYRRIVYALVSNIAARCPGASLAI